MRMARLPNIYLKYLSIKTNAHTGPRHVIPILLPLYFDCW